MAGAPADPYGEAYIDYLYDWRATLDAEELALYDGIYPGWPRDAFMPGLGNSTLPMLIAWGWEPEPGQHVAREVTIGDINSYLRSNARKEAAER